MATAAGIKTAKVSCANERFNSAGVRHVRPAAVVGKLGVDVLYVFVLVVCDWLRVRSLLFLDPAIVLFKGFCRVSYSVSQMGWRVLHHCVSNLAPMTLCLHVDEGRQAMIFRRGSSRLDNIPSPAAQGAICSSHGPALTMWKRTCCLQGILPHKYTACM